MKTNKKDIVLSTRNPGKLIQIQEIFKDSSFNLLTLDDLDIEGDVIEDGNTLIENAFKKVQFALEKSSDQSIFMADDSGIFIDALGGLPGVKSARWAGDVSTERIMEYTLSRMKDQESRKATFRTVVVVLLRNRDDGIQMLVFEGSLSGFLSREPRAEPSEGMPYSPIFVPEGENRVLAEMTAKELKSVSHRDIAFRKALSVLNNLF